MIEIFNKEDCCGCTACASICPSHCISMVQDDEGFLYPIVEKSGCIDCHLCEKKCPVKGKKKTVALPQLDKEETNRRAVNDAESHPETFVCFLKDTEVRKQSTSGGIFSALARHVLNCHGIICGVILDDDQKVIHAFAENENELNKMRRSKYVQSDQTGVYRKIKQNLKEGRIVLYSGTPCQVEGLESYLGEKYNNLITVDVFCHGVGSPLYWKKYVDYISEKKQSRISEICFREKTYGYNSPCLAVYFENGKSSHKGHDDDLYWSAFSKNLIYRPSCYACAFKKINHISDFSIGDYWNSLHLPEKYKEANGCSLVLCHTSKANQILDEISPWIEKQKVDLCQALDINGGHQPSMLIACPNIPHKRSEWFADMQKLDVNELVCKYIPLSATDKIKCYVKPFLYKVKLLDKIKEIRQRRKNE